MAREIELVSTTTGTHYLVFGLDGSADASFSIQMWIEKFGKRIIDFCQHMGLNFITFMGGDLWVHNQDDDDQDRCMLFDEKRDCIVGVVSNEEPHRVKLFDALGVYTNSEWEVTQIVIPPTLNYPFGMYSKIPKERFKKRDGVWRAELLRNMKTTSDTASVIEALSGEPMRGTHFYMQLKNTSNDQVKLFKVEVTSTKSRA